jgi:membrane protease YdiL (CAAX protease family)
MTLVDFTYEPVRLSIHQVSKGWFMTESTLIENSPWRLAIGTAAVIALWAGYTVLQTMEVVGQVSEGWSVALGFLPGVLGVTVLLRSGMTREECFLVFRSISKAGFVVLVLVFVFALSSMLPVMEWVGWSWKAALILAPASGIAQELFFRSTLLPTLRRLFTGRPWLALVVHAVLFGFWHIGPLFVGAPVWAVIAVMAVPFLSGIGWGWQVVHDRTVIWAMIQHSLIWVIGLQFAVAG